MASPEKEGESAGVLWYTMPFVEGESLRDRLEREHQLPIAEAVRITREAAQALAYAHRHSVIHRDIKPENLLLTKDGSVLVADFGIARALAPGTQAPGTGLTETGIAIGTPAYMAPETRLGAAADARSDIFSLAAVLYEMLTGKMFAAPGGGGFAAELFLPDTAPLLRVSRPDAPAALDALVRRGLHPNPDQRFASMEELATALDRASGQREGEAKRRSPRVRVLLPLIIVALLAAAGIWAWRGTANGPDTKAAGYAAPCSGGKHLLQHRQSLTYHCRWKAAETPLKPLPIHTADLIEYNVATAFAKPARDAERVWMPARDHRSDNEGLPVGVEFVGRHHQARTGFADLPAPHRFELYQIDFPTLDWAGYSHSHCSSSNRVDEPPINGRSSPRS